MPDDVAFVPSARTLFSAAPAAVSLSSASHPSRTGFLFFPLDYTQLYQRQRSAMPDTGQGL